MTTISRRTVIGGAAVAGAATAIGSVPVSGQVASNIEDFKKVSEVLTGIQASRLAPGVDPIKIHLAYAEKAMNDPEFPGAFLQLIKIFRDNKDKKPQEIADILLNKSGADVRYLARNIMIAWYFGSWCKKEDLKKYDGKPQDSLSRKSQDSLPRNQINHLVISPAAYTQGWIWRIAGTHPMGYSDLRFGYWENPPGYKVTDFI